MKAFLLKLLEGLTHHDKINGVTVGKGPLFSPQVWAFVLTGLIVTLNKKYGLDLDDKTIASIVALAIVFIGSKDLKDAWTRGKAILNAAAPVEPPK